MTIINENPAAENTPRTRNQVLDNTRKMTAPEGSPSKGEWTLRKQIEADFRALGFKSHKFSHKNEPENRSADSLWLSWNSDSKKRPVRSILTDIEVRVVFPVTATDHAITFTITHDGFGVGGCRSHRIGGATFVVNPTDTADVMAHVNYLLSK